MKLGVSKLSSAVRLALSLGAVIAVGATSTAFAQDTGTQSQDTTTQPNGKMALGDLVQQLPSMTGGNVNPQVNNGGGTGATSINLRGLGAKRTLILVNGHRMINALGSGTPDVNAIPAAAIERIEVLTDGASSTYGSDAIGGVV